jgi:hypothetical protein
VYSAWRCALEGEDCVCDGVVAYSKMTQGPGITFVNVIEMTGTVIKQVVP